jgi:hypothetical protein
MRKSNLKADPANQRCSHLHRFPLPQPICLIHRAENLLIAATQLPTTFIFFHKRFLRKNADLGALGGFR